MKILAAIGLSLATAVSTAMPAQAFPSFQGPKLEVSDVQQVRNNRYYRGGRYYGGGRNYYRYGGHYGHYHNNNDNFGWALGGLAAGAIIGGLIAQPGYYGGYGGYGGYYAPRYYAPRYYRPSYYGGNSHVSWCYARYRSYRAYDNTFQPYYGPRRQCIGPY